MPKSESEHKKFKKNSRSRRYLLTINNPNEAGLTHEAIKDILDSMSVVYYCLCDETGEEGTYHTHIYVVFKNAVYFDTLKNKFPTAHIDPTKGSSQENRDYIRKEGKYTDSEKKDTNHIETFEEYGELPLDRASKNESVTKQVFEMIKQDIPFAEIIEIFPSFATQIPKMEQMRQMILKEKMKNTFRNLEVTYIYGVTGSGKTRYVMEKYGYENVCKVTNYKHPFDHYDGQDVLLLDEFRSSIYIGDMLVYLDGYPSPLPARYTNKTPCYTKVYIISNISLYEQFKDIQKREIETWKAFLRRIDKVLYFDGREIIEELLSEVQ